jgi:hypothetical protein
MILSSNATRTVLFRIPRNYRYKGYQVKDGAVVQHASYTIRYVKANSWEVIQSLEDLNNMHAVKEGPQQSYDKNY